MNFNLSTFKVIATGSGGSSVYQLVMLDKDKPFSFKEGGIRQSDSNRSKVTLSHQIGGGLSYQVELNSGNFHNMMFTTSTTLTEINIYPLIAIETSKSLMDFLHAFSPTHACEKSACSNK